MTSKRDLKNDVDELSEEQQEGGGGIVVFTTGNRYETPDEAPRRELVVPDPEREGYKLAVPNVIPQRFDKTVLFVSTRVRETWPEPEETDDSTVPIARLWDELDETQLREEYDTRKGNDEPIPPLLEQYS